MDWGSIATVTAIAIAAHMTVYWLLSVYFRRVDIVDVGWGIGFVVVAWSLLLSTDMSEVSQLVLTGFVTVWGLRLAWHIARRFIAKDSEDYRYQAMRERNGDKWVYTSLLKVFYGQGVLMAIVSAPMFIAAQANEVASIWTWLGLAVAIFGLVFEAIGDAQLKSFLAHRKKPDEVMQSGLWRYTRHPNYFGESVQWWGMLIMVATLPYGLFAIISPLVITLLLTKISGIPLLEKRYDDNSAYQKYKAKTNAFIPGPVKRR